MITFLFCLPDCFCQKDTIKIGLLVQDKKSKAALQGAELAVKKANLRDGKMFFKLAVRDMEGPWGTGSKVAVDLVFNEKVWAIIGAVDGRNCHLAEQVSAKTRVPFLSSWSGDPTLAYAFIPWFFSCVPGDQQKASSIIDNIKAISGNTSPVIITAGDYDSRMGCGSFIKEASSKGFPKPVVFRFDTGHNFDSISSAISKMKTSNIIFYGPVSYCRQFRELVHGNQKFYCISYADGERSLNTLNGIDDFIFISPGYHFTVNGKSFTGEFAKVYGNMPGDLAAYSFDMTNIVINSIRAANDPDSLKDYIKKTNYAGVTGSISFDERGSRLGKIELMTVKKGKFVREHP